MQRQAADLAVRGLKITHQARNYQLSRGEKLMLAFFLATSPATVFAQGRAVGAMKNFASTVISMVQIAFIIVLAYGVFNVVRKFVTQDPGAFGSLATLLVGLLVWFGFNYFKDDIRSAMGGGDGGVTQ